MKECFFAVLLLLVAFPVFVQSVRPNQVIILEHNDFKGASLRFPEAGPSQDKSVYKLETYQFKDKISSLIVQGVGDEVLKMKTGTVITPQETPEMKGAPYRCRNYAANGQSGFL